MDPRTLLEPIQYVGNTAEGMQQVREKIIHLALRGKLHTQSAADTPTAETLASLVLDSQLEKYRQSVRTPEGVPATWSEAALGLVVHHRLGKTLNRSTGVGVPTRYLRSVNIQDDRVALDDIKEMLVPATELPKFNVKKGDVFVVEGGDAGRSAVWLGEDAPGLAFQNALHRLRATEAVIPEFLQLALRDARATGRLGALATGMTIRHLSTNSLKNLAILLPPVSEQRRIVAAVSGLMESCDLFAARLNERNQGLDALRSSSLASLASAATTDLLESAWELTASIWGPLASSAAGVDELRRAILQLAVTGRLSRSATNGENARDLLARIDVAAREFDPKHSGRSGTNSLLTEKVPPFRLPETWEWIALEGVCSHVVDCLHSTPAYSAEGYPAIRTSDIRPGQILWEQARRVSQDEYERQTQRLVPQAGDVFYSREGNFGNAAVVPRGVAMCLSQRMMQFRLYDGVDPRYFAWALNSPLVYQQAVADSLGSTVPHVNIRSLRKFWFPLPPSGEQLDIVRAVDEMMALCDSLEEALNDQAHRADAILEASSHLGALVAPPLESLMVV